MRKYIGWRFVDQEGQKWQAAVHFHAGKLIWTRQSRRFEPWETFEPTEEWWDALNQEAERFAPRGKVTPEELALIRRRGRKGG